jgi:Family of unknown function (DUF6998)
VKADRITLPKPVADIYRAVAELERTYPGRHFTPDGHLVGSIGEVVAREAFGFELHPASQRGHDASCPTRGDVQIKITAGNSVALRGPCHHLIVLKIVSPEEAEIVYDGPGIDLWEKAGPTASNGQRRLSLSKLRGASSLQAPGRP